MGIGGAMDLASGAKRIVVLTRHVTKPGAPKLLAECTYPLTAVGCVARVITDLGVFDIGGDHFRVVERAPDVGVEEIASKTDAPIRT